MPEGRLNAKILAELHPSKSRSNLVVTLLTTGEDEYPNVCLLSPFQVLGRDDKTIFFVVYSGSRTQLDLSKRGKATFIFFLPPAAYYAKGKAKRMTLLDEIPELRGNILYKFSVAHFSKDYYRRAPITSAVTFDQSRMLQDYSKVYGGLISAVNELP